jgi:glycosyltransferase involved in cell wall biosynthesis
MEPADIAVFILAFNERVHIERCIRSAQTFAAQVFVVDSGSSDGTPDLARALGAEVFFHAWQNNHARQTNWAIENLPIRAGWVMRMDADEVVTEALAAELRALLPQAPTGVNGFVVKRQQVFLGRSLRWGGVYPLYLLRIWRRGHGRCEDRWMDEHLVVTSGQIETLEHDLVDHNLRDLRWWTEKQANYAVREAADILLARAGVRADAAPQDKVSGRKRWVKQRVYLRMPPFVRPTAFFGYRYLWKLGFLDGRPGLIWHVLQAFWYRFLVDAIVFDLERRAQAAGRSELEVLRELYGLDAGPAPQRPAATVAVTEAVE